MRSIQAVFLVALGLATTPAFAEHICTNSPDEVYVGNTPAGQGQASMPVCRWANTDEGTTAQRPQTRVVDRWQVWDERFGAIASDNEGPLGIAEGHVSREDAKRAASEDCMKRGGDAHRCQNIVSTYRNSCAAFAWGGGQSMISIDPDGLVAEKRAVEACSKSYGTSCEVIYSGCSLPVERWTYEKPPGWVPAD